MTPPPTRTGWIPEVQGLRTLALSLVAVYHIWFGKVSGGVDVFLFVSAFLLVRSVASRAERGEPTKPLAFILRRFALLLPLTAVTVIGTLLAGYWLMPQSLTASNLFQGLASLTYWENIWLQDAEVAYLSNGPASPFQHFWSLSIQGQIFVIWPLLLAGCVWLARRFNLPVRTLLAAVFGLVTIAGFVYALIAVDANAHNAYFSLPARVWEFSAGSFLALVQPYLRFRAIWRIPMGWVGVLGLIACGAVLPEGAEFPGWPGLWPVGCAALVIMAAGEGSRRSARALLCHPWLQRAARYTYALYLTHWPVLVFVKWQARVEQPSFGLGVAVLAISIVLAVAFTELFDRPITRFVGNRSDDEKPSANRDRVRASRRIIAGLTGTVTARAAVALGTVLLLASGLVVGSIGVYRAQAAQAWAETDAMPAAELGANAIDAVTVNDAPILPSELVVRDDLTRLGDCDAETQSALAPTLARNCLSNVGDLAGAPTRTVMVVGNSQAQQAASLLAPAAMHEQWELRAFIYFSCQYNSFGRLDHKAQDCNQFWADAREYLLQERPDAVLLQITRSEPTGVDPELPGIWHLVDELEAAGIEVIAMRDVPRVVENPFACVELASPDDPACTFTTDLHEPRPELAERANAHGAAYLDVNDLICPDGVCRPVRGGVLVFMDANHQTATYMRTIAPEASRRIHEHLTWWPAD
ncbi:acyltransferase family protein [Gulosibacter bifidus]|uniref:Acyltransferase family protein n=1 Tax=Gulosibacter bifidus TaxID=272239 RepID=A0ABW5RHJ8_9MICO|nr:acyltransferase family protein [Gulosibacter bifidus]